METTTIIAAVIAFLLGGMFGVFAIGFIHVAHDHDATHYIPYNVLTETIRKDLDTGEIVLSHPGALKPYDPINHVVYEHAEGSADQRPHLTIKISDDELKEIREVKRLVKSGELKPDSERVQRLEKLIEDEMGKEINNIIKREYARMREFAAKSF